MFKYTKIAVNNLLDGSVGVLLCIRCLFTGENLLDIKLWQDVLKRSHIQMTKDKNYTDEEFKEYYDPVFKENHAAFAKAPRMAAVLAIFTFLITTAYTLCLPLPLSFVADVLILGYQGISGVRNWFKSPSSSKPKEDSSKDSREQAKTADNDNNKTVCLEEEVLEEEKQLPSQIFAPGFNNQQTPISGNESPISPHNKDVPFPILKHLNLT